MLPESHNRPAGLAQCARLLAIPIPLGLTPNVSETPAQGQSPVQGKITDSFMNLLGKELFALEERHQRKERGEDREQASSAHQ